MAYLFNRNQIESDTYFAYHITTVVFRRYLNPKESFVVGNLLQIEIKQHRGKHHHKIA